MPIAASRRALLSAFFLLLIGGQAFDVVFEREDWPFSSYPMYSEPAPSTATRVEFVGIGPQGEFPLTPEIYLAPLDRSRFQRVLSLIRRGHDASSRQQAVAAALLRSYAGARTGERGADPPLFGVRTYDVRWSLESGAANRAAPDSRQLSFYMYMPPAELRERMERAAAGALSSEERTVRHVAAAADVVVDAQQLATVGGVAHVADVDTSAGLALRFDGQALEAPAALPLSSATVEVTLAPRSYTLWLRGTVPDGTNVGSFWVEVVTGGRLRCVVNHDGMGNWREVFPAGAFAWSSAAPGAPPCIVEASGGPLELRITAREGPVLLDQLWLATAQDEAPGFAEAVARASVAAR